MDLGSTSRGLLDDIVNGCVAGADSDVQLFGSVVGNSSFGIYSAGTTSGWDAFRADIGSDGTWKSLSVEQGLGDESFQALSNTIWYHHLCWFNDQSNVHR